MAIPRSATYVRPDLVQRLGVWRPARWSRDIYAEAQDIAAAFSQSPELLYPQFYQTREKSVVQALAGRSPHRQHARQLGQVRARQLGQVGVRSLGQVGMRALGQVAVQQLRRGLRHDSWVPPARRGILGVLDRLLGRR